MTADKVVSDLRAACQFYADSIASGFLIGTARPDLGESYRVFTRKRWVIGFKPLVNGIEIMRVLDGGRDFSKLFKQ